MINTYVFDTYREENYMPSWYRLERYDFCEHRLVEHGVNTITNFLKDLYHKFF